LPGVGDLDLRGSRPAPGHEPAANLADGLDLSDQSGLEVIAVFSWSAGALQTAESRPLKFDAEGKSDWLAS
jgi:hypothetical protein